jgi:hypothetical protein
MKTRDQKTILLEHIVALQKQQEIDLRELKIQYHTTLNSFSTVNLLKTSLQEVLSKQHLTSNIIHGAINLGAQYLTKTILKYMPNITKRRMGKLIQLVKKRATKE